MKRNAKIKAFTISELMVVLLITVIVVGMAFSVLNLIQKQMLGMEQNFERNTEVGLLRQALWTDFSTFSDVSFSSEKQKLILKNEMGVREYNFRASYISRGIDTFRITITEKTIYFDGISTNNGPVDAIRLKTSNKYGAQTLFIYKINSAHNFIE